MQQQFKIHLRIRYKSAPNIALVKYWGKYHEGEIIPINDSLGLTLNTRDLTTITTCTFSNNIAQDRFRLNGKNVEVEGRMRRVLGEIRKAARKSKKFEGWPQEEWNQCHFQIESTNSFPTASGMASSASGFSCLASALNGLFDNILPEKEVSRLARWGSGSAARAVYGGLVRWQGVDQQYLWKQASEQQLQLLSRKCITYTVKPACDLSYMKVIILMSEDKQKEVSSTSGMRHSVESSELIRLRNRIANERIGKIMQLLIQIDSARTGKETQKEMNLFSQVGQQIMRDSNQFHAICLDTFPPIFYLNAFSRMVISMVHKAINSEHNNCKVAYSFDAGAHAFLFVHQYVLKQVLHYLVQMFQLSEHALNKKAKQILSEECECKECFGKYQGEMIRPSQLWVSDVGVGAQMVDEQ